MPRIRPCLSSVLALVVATTPWAFADSPPAVGTAVDVAQYASIQTAIDQVAAMRERRARGELTRVELPGFVGDDGDSFDTFGTQVLLGSRF